MASGGVLCRSGVDGAGRCCRVGALCGRRGCQISRAGLRGHCVGCRAVYLGRRCVSVELLNILRSPHESLIISGLGENDFNVWALLVLAFAKCDTNEWWPVLDDTCGEVDSPFRAWNLDCYSYETARCPSTIRGALGGGTVSLGCQGGNNCRSAPNMNVGAARSLVLVAFQALQGAPEFWELLAKGEQLACAG